MNTFSEVIAAARAKIGKPYSMDLDKRLGPDYYDCSGLMWASFAEGGLPLNGRTLNGDKVDFPSGPAVNPANIIAGDLVYRNLHADGYWHVGLVTNVETIIHASSSRGVVEDLIESWGVLAASRPYPEASEARPKPPTPSREEDDMEQLDPIRKGEAASLTDLEDSEFFNTYLVFTNPTTARVDLALDFWDADGNKIGGSIPLPVAPHATQKRRVKDFLDPNKSFRGWCKVAILAGEEIIPAIHKLRM